MAPERPSDLTRRTVLRGTAVGAVALPVLVACGDDDPAATGGSTPTSTPTGSATQPPPGGGGGGGGSGGDALAQTSDVPVGEAVFLDDPSVVITQPSAGEFHAFDRTCTHQKCPVTDLLDGNIHCSCHDSLYDPATGAPVGGPAPSPLTEFPITVKGDQILPG